MQHYSWPQMDIKGLFHSDWNFEFSFNSFCGYLACMNLMKKGENLIELLTDITNAWCLCKKNIRNCRWEYFNIYLVMMMVTLIWLPLKSVHIRIIIFSSWVSKKQETRKQETCVAIWESDRILNESVLIHYRTTFS